MESEEKNTTVEEEEDDEEGPPPGFQCIVVPQQKETMETDLNEEEEEEVDDDGDDDDDVDSDGPPPGWSPIPQPVPKIQTSDAEMFDKQDDDEDDDEDDNGPPPGWDLPPPTPLLAEAIPSGEMEGKQEETKAGDQSTPVSQPLAPIPPLPAPATLAPSGKGQMVCGSCRQLLSYPRGVKYVQCSCCQTVNLVLEAHQVGQVKCGGCAVLLMYPFGAPSVKCSSCCIVTDIGEHNRRPPLSVQQERRQPPFNRVH